LGQGIDAKQVAARMVPVVSGLAVEGVQTATMVMRALAKEAGKLLREDAPISSPVDAWY
jgi:orotate phosphoribosyltransferase